MIKYQIKLSLLSLVLAGFLLHSCSESKEYRKNLNEGIIEYEVTYPELDSDDIMLEMLPDKMIMKFKNDKIYSNLSAGAGLIEMGLMIDISKKKMFNMVKIFGDRYVLELTGHEVEEMTHILPPFQIKNLKETKVIADANCEKVLLDFGMGKEESYIFYYTNDIAIESPNWYTPYSDIKGVLLDYRIENYNMQMRLVATKIIPQELKDSEFEIDARYKNLSKEEFDKVVVQNMAAFME